MEALMRVLLVEDDVDLAELLAGQLGRLGFQVRLAHRFSDACAISGAGLDAVVTDGELPDGSAVDVARHFAALPKVALTGNPAGSAALLVEHGFHAALVKPVSAKVLAQVVREAVAGHSPRPSAPATPSDKP
jgi:DNA-binding response OmpR family regulator